MPTTNKNKKRPVRKKTVLGVVIDPTIGSFEKHSFFVKKAREAKALIDKYGLPEEVMRKMKK